MNNATRFLVTGGAGFIGSHLVDALAAAGHRVRVLDDFSSGKQENVAEFPAAVEVLEGSLTDVDLVHRAAEGCRGIFHLAAIPSVVKSVEQPVPSHDANVTGTVNVLEAARRLRQKVVYAGSSSAYGNTPTLPKREDMREEPLSPYAVTKLASELYLRAYSQVYGLETVTTRFFNVFGPRQAPDNPYTGVIAKFIHALMNGQPVCIEGDGGQTRDFTYVSDTVEGVVLAMTTKTPPATLVNIARGEQISILQLAGLLMEATGCELPPVHVAPRTGDVRDSFADIDRARRLLSYAPKVSVREGLQMTVDWYQKVCT
jgi:nucleoside-diphosphate-sugar epimerase